MLSGKLETLQPPLVKQILVSSTGVVAFKFSQKMQVLPSLDIILKGLTEQQGQKLPIFNIEV